MPRRLFGVALALLVAMIVHSRLGTFAVPRIKNFVYCMDPLSLNLKGGTQPEIFQGTVDAITHELRTDPTKFWQAALAKDGPIDIWEIQGERWLFNGHHRYHAAIQAGVDIPTSHIRIVVKTGSPIPTWRFDQMTWLPGLK